MGRKRSFLGFLATVVMVLFTANAFAAGYTCDNSKVYTTCNATYYLSDDTCLSCLIVTSDETQSCSGADTIDNGSRAKSGTQQCTSNFTGGVTGALGTEQCSGCANDQWGNCDYTSYVCTCNPGYSVANQGTAACSCSANTITLDWNENGGNAVTNGSCTYNGDLILPGTPTRSGYTFTGWKLADGTVKSGGATVSGGCTSTYTGATSGTSTAITAQWSQCGECTKGTGVDSCTVSVSNNTCVATATCSTGYKTPTCTSGLACSCAQNVFQVTVNKNGGSGSLTVNGTTATGTDNVTFSCTYGDTITLPTWGSGNALTKNNSTFTGWTESSFTCTGDKTVSAQWLTCTTASKGNNVGSATLNGVTNNQCQYTHVCAKGYYHSSHNTKTTSSSINCSECTGLPANAEWTGAATSNACAWDCKACAKGSNAASCAVTKGTNSCTYTGTCVEKTFNPTASGVTVSCSACPDNSVTGAGNAATECTCDEGHSVGGTQGGVKTTSSAACSEITYNIAYELNGASANYSGAPTTYKYGTGATINGTPVRAGYSFGGWCTDSGLGSCAMSQTIGTTALGDKKFYAKWNECNSTANGACDCASGTYPLNGVCTSCVTSCSGITGYTSGEYNICSGDKSTCYRSCTTADITGATAVAGKYNYQNTNNCYATSCDSGYYLTGVTGQTVCQKCTGNAVCPGGTADWSCPDGYTKNSDTDSCDANEYTITFDGQGATTAGTKSVQAEYDATVPNITAPTRDDYDFMGYFGGKNGSGTQYYNSKGQGIAKWDIADNATLYAHWDSNVIQCTAGQDANGATCPIGYYCPGEKVSENLANDPTQGCARKCPTATGMTVTSPVGATSNVQCTATGIVDIYAADTTKYPNSTGTGTRTCNYDGTDAYDESCAIVPTSCIGGFYRENTTSPYCNPVGYKYYRGAGEDVLTRRACADLSGADSTTTTVSETSSSPTACYNTCSAVTIANGTLSPVNSTETYNGTQIPVCDYITSCATGYSVSGSTCVPAVFKVTLNHNGGTSNTSAIYLKYANSWCADASCNTSITSVEIPVLAGQTFGGYKSGGTGVADASGTLTTNYTIFTDHATVTASWDAKPQVSCLAGTYYPGTGEECDTCPAGSFCTGGLFDQDMGVQGISTCESLNGTYTAATDAAGKTLTVTISSPAGAKDASYCFAANVAYTPNQQTMGSQTCKYDTALKSYTTGCDSQVVYTCSGGYALATENAIACTIVDKGYYSPDKALTATQCPYNTDTNTYGTTEDYGASGIGMCIMDNLWFENDTSGQRRKCYYSTESEKYDVNCPFSNIVTCIAGYWYDSSQSTTDCVPVGNGYYSPAQSACTGESAQPTSAGCSTKRTSCGVDTDGNQINTKDAEGNITETATSATYCEGLCEENYFCVPGEEPQSCSDATDGEYPYSVAGSDDIGDCYKKDDNCACSRDCPDKGVSVNSCVVKGADTFSGIIYQGNPDVCVLPDTGVAMSCSYKQVSCNDNYYFNGTFNASKGLIEGDWSCKPCSTLGSGYDTSRASGGYFPANHLNGSTACFKSVDLYCTAPVCPLTDRSEYCLYDASTFETMAGWKFYGNETVYPALEYDNFVCPATDSDGSYFACKTGYDKNVDANIDPTDSIEDSQPADLCVPHVYTITLDANWNGGTDSAMYQKYKTGFYADADAITPITQVAVPARVNWTFHGYYTTPSALTTYAKIINADGTFVNGLTPEYTSDMTLYAWWTQDVTACQAGMYYTGVDEVHAQCPVGKYCPGVGNAEINSGEGCMATCPQDGWTVSPGESVITSCHKTFNEGDDADKVFDNGLATWDCTWLGDEVNGAYSSCDINIAECDAGYYNPANEKVCRPAESGYWSPDKDLNQIQCAAKTNYTVASDNGRDSEEDCYVSCSSYTPSVAHSTSVYVTPGDAYSKMYYSVGNAAYPACQYTVECETGYEAVSGMTPQCKSKEYVVTLDKNGGSGVIADSVRCTFGNECALPATTVLTRAGYNTANKWCTNADGSGICFDVGTTVSGNISANGTDTKLYAIWAPGVFKVTLTATDAETNAEQGPVYLKYETGWFSDVAATKPLAELGTDLPRKAGYNFAGYKVGEVSIVNANGAMQMTDAALTVTTTDTTASVAWSKGLTTCEAGYYYVGSGSQCAPCTAGNYCTGGRYPTDEGPAGETPCPNSGVSVGGTSAINVAVCYKEQMAYATYIDSEKTLARAQGTWTCNYDTIGYTNCHEDTVEITWCAGGYWYNDAQNTIDCVEVGEGNFSPEEDLKAYVCPDNGNTAGSTTSDSLGDCVKRMNTYVSDTGNASGTHVCNARQDGDVVKYDQNCTDIEVTWCAGGYWYNEDTSKIDCDMVGENRYSPDGDMMRYDCPHGGTTKSTTANAAHGVCQKTMTYPGIDYTGPAVHGTGIRGCYYDSASDGKMFGTEQSDGYLLNCGDITMTECNPGYYWSARTATVCDKVDFGFFGPVVDTNNSNNWTARQVCPDNGKTLGDTSANATSCYKEQLACDVANGTGEQTRFYDAEVPSDTNGYNICYTDNQQVECNTTCSVTGCDTGFSLVNGVCISCPADHVCTPNGGQQTCLQATGGTHDKSDAGTEDVAYCYTDCALGGNAAQMTGRDYYGTNVKDTCTIKLCVAGYTLSNGVCVKCPAGAICDPSGGSDEPQSCATLTGGTHTESALGSDSKDDCFKVCEPYAVENGTAVPVTDTVFWPNDCEFKGQSVNGNPCDIVDGVCVETSCNYNFEMVNGVCKPCAREHAISYKTNGNCVVESCANGYHPNGQACEVDVIECTAENAVAATQTWDAGRNAFGACIITQCADGYHLGANACQIDSQVCELEHGVGIREWNHKTNTWGECIATECDPGYTNDRNLTNELWEQCGRCNNMYSANGELAVSSYVNGCEIAACMYQGELYALENNECRLICDEYSDETGSRRWNASRKKCERTCEPGYTSW